MLLPRPELAGEGDGVVAGGVNQRFGGEGHGCGAEDDVAEADEGDQEQQFEGVGEVVGQLRGGNIEAEDECRGEAEDGGAAQNGVDADEEADGDAPGEFLRGGAHAEEREDGKGDSAVEPVVVERRSAGLGVGGVYVARAH